MKTELMFLEEIFRTHKTAVHFIIFICFIGFRSKWKVWGINVNFITDFSVSESHFSNNKIRKDNTIARYMSLISGEIFKISLDILDNRAGK